MAKPDAATAIAPARLVSLDAYRGLVMLLLAASGFGIAQAAQNFPDSRSWQFWGNQFSHVPWRGCTLWDLIQPSFMFLVGVAVPFSFASRVAAGQSGRGLYSHALIRATVLILMGIVLRSNSRAATNFTFEDVLTQIGLGYPLLVLLWQRRLSVQFTVVGLLLAGYWGLFAVSPAPLPTADLTSVGVPADWPRLTGFEAHWEKNANPAHRFDVWFLNLFPRHDGQPFVFNAGGYQTLNFLPSLVTMIFGLMAGELIRRQSHPGQVVLWLIGSGLFLVAVGLLGDTLGICPLVKRIWTPTWACFSSGVCLLVLALLYGIADGLGWRWLFWPLAVAGQNSIALYVMSVLLRPWTAGTLRKHFGEGVFALCGAPYTPIVEATAVLMVFWLFVWWLARQRIFFRI